MNVAENPPAGPPRQGFPWRVPIVALVLLAASILLGAVPRLRGRERVRKETAEQAIPVVAVTRPERVSAEQELVLPGNVQAYASAPIFSRASGYVRRWLVDIGARVKKGQLLAELDIPEVTQQLKQAQGNLAVSQANLELAESTAKRFTDLGRTRAVSRQEIDNAIGAREANRATLAANEANVRELQQLASYARVRAPFDGIITARNVDVGDLINAGSSTTPGTSLFQISQSDRLRVYVSVPELYSRAVTTGMTTTLGMAAFPGVRFTGTLVRTASAIDPVTRTLLVEIRVPNPALTLFAGAFAEVRLSIPPPGALFTVPVEALVFRKEGLQLATVVDGHVVMKPVTPARDFGERMEISQGLSGDEVVIVSPPDSIGAGTEVRIAPDRRTQ